MTPAEQVEALRALHSPSTSGYYLHCEGCDHDGYESEAPEWPCRSAEMLYSAPEIGMAQEKSRAARTAHLAALRAELARGSEGQFVPPPWLVEAFRPKP